MRFMTTLGWMYIIIVWGLTLGSTVVLNTILPPHFWWISLLVGGIIAAFAYLLTMRIIEDLRQERRLLRLQNEMKQQREKHPLATKFMQQQDGGVIDDPEIMELLMNNDTVFFDGEHLYAENDGKRRQVE